MYISTRGQEKLTASQAVLKGLADNGGLFIPEVMPKLNISNCLGKNYVEIAKQVFTLFLDDYTESEIDYAISKAYNRANFNECFCKVETFEKCSFLELHHGPTLAFKDMALTILPFLIEIAKKKQGVTDKSLILVATSGDTGGAALSSFGRSSAFDTVVLYPDGGVSEIQEKQMLYYTNDRTHAYAVKGNFDDCQTFVKEVFSSYPKNNGVILSSANSINIGRLIPQLIYYVYAYSECVKKGTLKAGEQFDVCVPTGNFGDIFAAYLAKEIGLPIKKFICASNVNNVLTDFFTTGVYNRLREFKKSNSPAMDILVSSNLERLVYLATGKDGERCAFLMKELKEKGSYSLSDSEKAFLKDFVGNYTDENQTKKTISDAFNELNYLIDPHTAVAYDCYKKVGDKNVQTLIVSTASPYKFPFTVAKALGLNENKSEFELIGDIASFTKTIIPFGISKLKHSIKPTILKTKEEISKIVKYEDLKVEVKVPCSSANLGSAFDSSGIAFNLYNSFVFEANDVDEMVGFKGSNENNLVYKAYKKVFEVTGRSYIPCKITLGKCGIQTSKGLGSSSTCIVAGVLGANYMLKNLLTENELLSIMVAIEGHPDNVVPAYLGGLVSSCVLDNGEVVYTKTKPNRKLKMFAVIPNFETNTKKSREGLPTEYSREDVTYNLSRVALLQTAFANGDLDKIKVVFSDKLHEPYRLPNIKGAEELKSMLENLGYAVAISGSGPSLLVVGYDGGLTYKIPKEIGGVKWKVKELKCDDVGAKVIAYNF